MRDNRWSSDAWDLPAARDPLYVYLAKRLEELIESGHWKKGEMLPSEIKLAELFKVSPGTARSALKILTEKGVLLRRQGKGTFVADYEEDSKNALYRFVRLVPDDNLPRVPTRTTLELFEVVLADRKQAELLGVDPFADLIHVKRAHFIRLRSRDECVSLDEHFLVRRLFPTLTAEKMEHHKERLLYAFYQKSCGVTITNYSETVRAELLAEDLCARYGFSYPMPVIVGRRIARTFNNIAVELRLQHYTTNHYHFTFDF